MPSSHDEAILVKLKYVSGLCLCSKHHDRRDFENTQEFIAWNWLEHYRAPGFVPHDLGRVDIKRELQDLKNACEDARAVERSTERRLSEAQIREEIREQQFRREMSEKQAAFKQLDQAQAESRNTRKLLEESQAKHKQALQELGYAQSTKKHFELLLTLARCDEQETRKLLDEARPSEQETQRLLEKALFDAEEAQSDAQKARSDALKAQSDVLEAQRSLDDMIKADKFLAKQVQPLKEKLCIANSEIARLQDEVDTPVQDKTDIMESNMGYRTEYIANEEIKSGLEDAKSKLDRELQECQQQDATLRRELEEIKALNRRFPRRKMRSPQTTTSETDHTIANLRSSCEIHKQTTVALRKDIRDLRRRKSDTENDNMKLTRMLVRSDNSKDANFESIEGSQSRNTRSKYKSGCVMV